MHPLNFETYFNLIKQDFHDLTQQSQPRSLLASSNLSKDQMSNYYQFLTKSNINEIKVLNF